MYDINKKESAIREVQKYLGEIGYVKNPPALTGIYDDRTRAGVKAVQKSKSISESGVVDLETMTALYEEYIFFIDRAHAARRARVVSFPIRIGDSGRGIREINEALVFLMDYYREGHRIKISSYFGEPSASAAEALYEIYGMDKEDGINEFLYLRMYEDIDSIKRLENMIESRL